MGSLVKPNMIPPPLSPHAAQSPVSQIIWNTVRNPHILDNEGYSNISDNILISAWPVQLRHSCRAIFPHRASLFYIVCHSEAWPWLGWARHGVMDVFRRVALWRRGFWFWKQDKNCARRSTCPCSQKEISQTYVNIIYAYCTDMCTCTWLLVTRSYWWVECPLVLGMLPQNFQPHTPLHTCATPTT